VLEENSTDVSIYLPKGVWYDWWTLEQVEGKGEWVNLSDVAFDSIPLHIHGGAILPLRAESANTTTELRKQDFVLWIAPNSTGQASGSLYLDDGDSIEQEGVSEIVFSYDNGAFEMSGAFGYQTELVVRDITLLGKDGQQTLQGPVPLTGEYSVKFNGNFTGGGAPPQFEGKAARNGVGALVGVVAGVAMLGL
jgi:alpha-glucosidase